MKRTRNKDLDIQLGDSPLLSRGNGSEESTSQSLQSTIHPERFDMSRFSDMQEKEEGPFKVVFYVVGVIVIGVVLALVVRQLISNNQTPLTDNTNQTSTETGQQASRVEINTSVKSDADATERPLENDFGKVKQVSAGNVSAQVGSFAIDTISYNKFTSFGRVDMKIVGLSSISNFPALKFEFADNGKLLKISMPTGYSLDNNLVTELVTEASEVGDLLSSIVYTSASNTIELRFREEVLYRILPAVSKLVIDFKPVNETSADETVDETETATDEEALTPELPVNTPTAPTTGVNYTNEFSRVEQFIKSKVTGNTIAFNNFYYEDTGSFFEFSWGITNQANENVIPNVSAKPIVIDGVNYIEVKISNLSNEPFALAGLANLGTDLLYTGINLSAANFVRVDRTSYENGVATYRVRVKNISDFRIVADTTIGDPTPDQVINLQIRD